MAEHATLASALAWARRHLEAVDAKVLLCHASACSAATIAGFGERELTPPQWRDFQALVERRRAGVPVAYLTEAREFYSRSFRVGDGVLIPRPETELLVEQALKAVAGREGLRALDLGTGSGVIAITLALELGAALDSVVAVDRSSKALGYAVWNAGALGARVSFHEADWLSGLGDQVFDLIVGNPPYVCDTDPHLAAGDLRYEPQAALAAGADGLDDIRRIIAASPPHLARDGLLMLEHGHGQAAPVRALLEQAGFDNVVSVRDIAGIERVTRARWGSDARPR